MSCRKCEICGLRSGRKDNTKRYFMARFPLDEARCKLWVKFTGNEDLAYVPIEKLHQLKFVCGSHFKENDFKKKKTQLRKTAVPSLRPSSKPLTDEVLSSFPYRIFKEQHIQQEGIVETPTVSAQLEHSYCHPGVFKINLEPGPDHAVASSNMWDTGYTNKNTTDPGVQQAPIIKESSKSCGSEARLPINEGIVETPTVSAQLEHSYCHPGVFKINLEPGPDHAVASSNMWDTGYTNKNTTDPGVQQAPIIKESSKSCGSEARLPINEEIPSTKIDSENISNSKTEQLKYYLESEIPEIEVFVEVQTSNTSGTAETTNKFKKTHQASEVQTSQRNTSGTAAKKNTWKKTQNSRRQRSTLQTSPQKKKLIKKLNTYKLKLKALKKKAKIYDSIKSKALKTILANAYKNQNRPAQGKRWSNSNKTLAIAMFKKSPKLYRFFRHLVPMPSERTIQSILSKMPIKPGLNKTILNHLHKRASQFSDKDKTCILAFDEMSLKTRLIYNQTLDLVEGYQDLAEHGRSGVLADKALVLLLQGVHKKYKQPVGHYFVKGTISSEKLLVIIKTAIKAVSEIGFNVIATVCDQGPTNIGALNLLKEFSHLPPDNNFFFVDNRKVYIIFDVPHLFKSIRNNLFEGGELIFDGMRAKWQHLKELHEKNTETLHFKKITALNVNPQFKAKMKVKLAAQILSNDVSAILNLYANTFTNEKENDGRLKRESLLQTSNVIKQLDLLFDVTNGPASRKDTKPGIRENVSKNSIHHKLWPEFKNKIKTMYFQKNDSQLRLRNIRCIKGYYTTLCSLQDIWKYVESIGFKYLNLRQLNQDSLENLFGVIRQHSPTNKNPTCHHFTAALKTTILTRLSTPVRGGNCEQDENELMLDFHDLVFENSNVVEDITEEHNYMNSREECFFDGPSEENPIIHLADDTMNLDEKLFENFKKQPVVYVSGYLASALIKCTSCHTCWDSLRVENPEENKLYKLIALKEWWPDKLSLTYPTLELCKTVDICVDIFEREVRPHQHNDDIGKYCQLLMSTQVHTSWLCKEHQQEMLEMLLFRLTTLLIRNECRNVNLAVNHIEQKNADVNKMSQLMSTAK